MKKRLTKYITIYRIFSGIVRLYGLRKVRRRYSGRKGQMLELWVDPVVSGSLLVFSFILGTVAASAMTCLGGRLAGGGDWLRGHSACDHCGRELKAPDLIPVLSWLIHGGKCRYCGKKLSWGYPLGECAMGILFVLTIIRYRGLCAFTVRDWLLASVLLALSVVDLKIYEIPNGLIIAGIVIWAAGIPFSEDRLGYVRSGLIGGFVMAGSLLLISLLLDRILKKDSLGGGDIKLIFMVSLYLGLAGGLLCLIVSCVIGLLFVAVMKKNRIPFGPSISLAAVLTLLYGSKITDWYLGLLR